MKERENKRNERNVTNVKISFSICLSFQPPFLMFQEGDVRSPPRTADQFNVLQDARLSISTLSRVL